MCFILPSVVDHPHCMHDHLSTASNKKKNWSSMFSFSASSCPIFPPSFCLKLPVLSKHKETKSGGREHEEMMTSLHQRVSRGLSVSHTQVSQSQETHYCCQTLPNMISRRFLFGWFWSILRSCSKIRQQKTPLSDLGDHSHHWLHSFLLMTCFVSCHEISVTRPKEKKKSIKLEQKQGDDKRKRWFSAMKKIWRTIEATKSENIKSIHWRTTRGLSVSHTSHSFTRNTLLVPNQSQNNQPRHSLWLIQAHQLRLPVMLKQKKTNKGPLCHTLVVTISTTASTLISLDAVCPLPSDPLDKTWGEKKRRTGNMKIKQGDDKRKRWFSAMKKFEEQLKQRNQKIINNWKNKRLKERNLKNIFFFNIRTCLFKQEQKKRDGFHAPDVPRPRSMTTECRMRSSTHVNIERRVCCKNQFLFWMKSNDNFWFFVFFF